MESVEHYREYQRLHRCADHANHGRFICYFIGASSGPIKIGVSESPALRLAQLQCGSPRKLMLLATAFGGFKRERAYHFQFAALRVRGEWFRRHHTIVREIKRLGDAEAQRPPMTQDARVFSFAMAGGGHAG